MVTGRVKHTIEGYEPHELSNLFVSFYPVGTTVRTDEYKTRPRIGVAGMYDSNGVLYELVNGKKSPVPGVNLWASMGEHVEPSGWTWRASWTFGIEPVNFTLRENETIDLSVVILEDTPANNGELFRDVALQVKKDSEQAAKSADKAATESASAKQSKEASARAAKESSSSAYISVNSANKATAAKIDAETASAQAISAANTSLNLSGEFNSLAESARLSESSASAHAQRSETAASTAVNSQLAAKVSQDAAKASQDAAKASQDAAKASQDAAKQSETNSATKATAAINAAQQAETAAATAVAATARLATGTIAITVAGNSGTVAVTFPAGRFTAPPVVLVSRSTAGLAKYVPYVESVTATGCVLGLYAGDGTAGSGSSKLSWIAVQTQS